MDIDHIAPSKTVGPGRKGQFTFSLMTQTRMVSFNCISIETMSWFADSKSSLQPVSNTVRARVNYTAKRFPDKDRFFPIYFVQVHRQLCWQEWSLQKRVKNVSWFATFGLFCGAARNRLGWQEDKRRHLASASDFDRVVIWILHPSDPVAFLYQP